MKLTITTPLAIVVETDGIVHLRAEDQSGLFGILRGHADFVTALSLCVASWRDESGSEHHAALRGGMLEINGGNAIAIATREAVLGDDLHHLETEALAKFHRDIDEEKAARTDAQRLYLAAIGQIFRLLRVEHPTTIPGSAGFADIENFGIVMAEPQNHDGLDKAVRLRRERRARWQKEGERSLGQNLAMIGAFGWTIVAPTLVGIFVGRWLDRTFSAGIFWTLGLLVAGLSIGCWLAWTRMNQE